MALSHSWFGAPLGSTTSIALQFPVSGTGVDAGDAVMARVDQAALSGTGAPTPATAPAGWDLVYSKWGGSGVAVAAGVGSRMISVYRRRLDATALESGAAVTFANPGDSSYVYGYVYGIGKSPLASLAFAGAGAGEATSGTAYSEVLDSNPGITAGDYLDHLVASPLDSGAWSAQGLTASGATIGAFSEIVDASTSSGHDERASHAWATVTSGTATAAPTMTITRSTASTGVLALLRVREIIVPKPPPRGPNYRR